MKASCHIVSLEWKLMVQGSTLNFLNFGSFHFLPPCRWWLLLGGRRRVPTTSPETPPELSWRLPWCLELCLGGGLSPAVPSHQSGPDTMFHSYGKAKFQFPKSCRRPHHPWRCWWHIVLPHPVLHLYLTSLWIFIFCPGLSVSFAARPLGQISAWQWGRHGFLLHVRGDIPCSTQSCTSPSSQHMLEHDKISEPGAEIERNISNLQNRVTLGLVCCFPISPS